jgi:signal transduction histidine kinase
VGLVSAVPQDLSRMLLNLLNNACYAVQEKQRAGVADFRPTIRICTRNLGDRAEVRVRDNGTGVPAAIRDKIFQPFFTTKPAGAGTGLGLSITYEIVTHEHRGELRLESEEGSYAEFIVTLPKEVAPEQ